ncbi:MAG TPA: FtsX-like permease family protein, partial [Chthoniobacterales bacterium]
KAGSIASRGSASPNRFFRLSDSSPNESRVTANYLRLFRAHVLRYIARHRLLAALNILSVALGVAVYLAIQIANHSATSAFAATIDIVAGKADLEITAPNRLPDDILPAVARQPGISAATPMLRGFVSLPDFPGEYLQVLGLDVFTNEPFRTFELTNFTDAHEFDIERWLGDPDAIAITRAFAEQHALKPGDTVRVQVNGTDRTLRVSFIMQTNDASAFDPHFAAMDIGWAQELFAERGRLSSIQLRLTNPKNRDAIITELRSIVPAEATVAAPAQRGEQVEKMLAGFQLNLTAMSLVSLLVGMFLIYNTISASVVRRRSEIGILRSLGSTRTEVRALFLAEALVLGTIGVVVGLAGGVMLARALVGTVSETISSLYVLLSVQHLTLNPTMFCSAAALGLASVLIAAWLPAAAAANMPPVHALRAGTIVGQSANLSPAWLRAGLVAIIVTAVLSLVALTSGPPWIAFGAAFFVLIGFSLAVPSLVRRFSHSVARRVRRPIETHLAAANLGRALVRNSVTIAALAAAVAMAIGVSVMVFSFRRTVEAWIDQTLVADLFVAPASNEVVGPRSFIPPQVISYFEQNPAVAAVDTFREIGLSLGNKIVAVAVVRGSARRNLQFIRGDGEQIMRRFYNEQCVLVSESFARRNHVHDGGFLTFTTPDGPQRFVLAGTFYDYTRDQGVVYMSARNFVQFWKDDRVSSLAVYLRGEASAETLTSDFRSRFSSAGEFLVLSNRELRVRVFEIFDQTFAVTYVLRTIAVIVAIVGICLTLTTLITERSRELGVLRAIGASTRQLRKLLLWEAAMIGLLAAVIGLGSGLALSVVLTGVINRAFFGWTIQLAFPWRSLALTPLWIIAAAVVAGVVPAWRAGQLVIAETVREE